MNISQEELQQVIGADNFFIVDKNRVSLIQLKINLIFIVYC